MGHKPPIPERLSPEGKDFLSHCLESEPRMRWTASQLLDHSFVKVTLIHKSPALCQDRGSLASPLGNVGRDPVGGGAFLELPTALIGGRASVVGIAGWRGKARLSS